jgi:hypothetical protein
MKKTLLAMAALALLTFSSCKKDDDDNRDTSVTKEALAGDYKLVSASAKVGSLPEFDATDQYADECALDDILTLKTDFTFLRTDAGVKCSPVGDETGTWALPGNNKIVIEGQELTIIKWDGKELHGTTTQTIPVVGQATLTVKFKKQ